MILVCVQWHIKIWRRKFSLFFFLAGLYLVVLRDYFQIGTRAFFPGAFGEGGGWGLHAGLGLNLLLCLWEVCGALSRTLRKVLMQRFQHSLKTGHLLPHRGGAPLMCVHQGPPVIPIKPKGGVDCWSQLNWKLGFLQVDSGKYRSQIIFHWNHMEWQKAWLQLWVWVWVGLR